jgi:hypothetical protein
MRTTRTIAGATASITAALGLTLALAGPASAHDGTWVAYGSTNPITSSTSLWHCATSRSYELDVVAQSCAVRSYNGTGDGVQGAIIVRNNRSTTFVGGAVVSLSTSSEWLGDWLCNSSGIAAHSWSVCFSSTILESSQVVAEGFLNNSSYGDSPSI